MEIDTKFSHVRPDGSSCFTALQQKNVSYYSAGENIAYGQTSPAQVMNSWMNSEGHRANILSSSFNARVQAFISEKMEDIAGHSFLSENKYSFYLS